MDPLTGAALGNAGTLCFTSSFSPLELIPLLLLLCCVLRAAAGQVRPGSNARGHLTARYRFQQAHSSVGSLFCGHRASSVDALFFFVVAPLKDPVDSLVEKRWAVPFCHIITHPPDQFPSPTLSGVSVGCVLRLKIAVFSCPLVYSQSPSA